MDLAVLDCPVEECEFGRFQTLKEVLVHVRKEHRSGTGRPNVNRFCCRLEGCRSDLSTYDSYRVHLNRSHGLKTSGVDGASVDSACDGQIEYMVDDAETAEGVSEAIRQNVGLTDDLGMVYMRCREKHSLAISVVKEIMGDLVELAKKNEIHFRDGLDPPGSNLTLSEAWEGLKSESQYRRFCLSRGLIEPQQIRLGGDEGQSDMQSFCYVSVLDTLRKYLAQKDVLNSMRRAKNFKPLGVMTGFTHGENFQTSEFFNGPSNCLRLHLYCDELEVCNPLGGSRLKHKLTCFYYVIGNIESKYLSSLRNFHVLAVARSSTVKNFGYCAVLERACHELLVLECQGIDVLRSDGDTIHFTGGVATISGDNLGSHDIGGFRKCFSSGRICRFCMCIYDDIRIKCNERFFTMRSQAAHDLHVCAVEADSSLVSAYGVCKDSPLKPLRSFSVISGLPSDLMHDVLQCIIPVTVEVILSNLFSNGIISRSHFEERLKGFIFGRNDARNVPKNYSLSLHSMNAAETWCYFRNLPFVLYDIIPEEFEEWELYVYLSRICDILFAPIILDDWIPYLDTLVSDFYVLLKNIAPDKIKPKFHFMLHYPTQIKRLGPLRAFWCMRFEAYHQRIKKIVRLSRNFKNLCFTVTKRIQYMKCWEQASAEVLCDPAKFIEKKELYQTLFPHYLCETLHSKFPEQQLGEKVIFVKSLTFDAGVYTLGDVAVLDVTADGISFCIITDIFKSSSAWYLCGIFLKVLYFARKYHSYCVEKTSDRTVFIVGSQLNAHPLDLYTLNGSQFVRLRYNIIKV